MVVHAASRRFASKGYATQKAGESSIHDARTDRLLSDPSFGGTATRFYTDIASATCSPQTADNENSASPPSNSARKRNSLFVFRDSPLPLK